MRPAPQNAPPSQSERDDASERTPNGFDRTLIREFLRLTPDERLARHDSMVRLILELRNGRRR